MVICMGINRMNPIGAMSSDELYKLAGILSAETRKAQSLLHKVEKEIRRRKRAAKPTGVNHGGSNGDGT